MPTQQIPVVPGGGAVSRRHAKLLHHLFENNGGGASVNAPVKDLRIRHVVPPASAPPPDCSPDPPLAAPAADKPVPVPAAQIQAQARAQSTPPEPSAAAAAEDRERKPMLLLPRSKLVRDPASFGYRRLLPFLNQMAASDNGCSDLSLCKDAPSEARASVPNKELAGSDPEVAADESVDGSQGGAANVVEPKVAVEAAADRASDCSDTANEEPKVAVEAGADGQMRDSCDTVREEPKVVSAASKPCVTRCARSKLVHHPSSSFSYKRMLPFLMENDISSQEEEENRCKIRRVSSEEEQLASGGNEEHNGAQVDRVVEERSASVSDGNCAGQIQSVSSRAEAQDVTREQVLASVADQVSSEDAAAPGGGQGQPAVVAQDDSPRESDVAGAEATVLLVRKDSESDDKSAPMEDSAEPQSLAKAAGGDQEMKDSVKEQTNIVPAGDPTSSKPCLPRCSTRRSRLVHQRDSFSYKRMLPFLMENHDISSQQGGDRTKLQTVPEEKQLSPTHESDLVMASSVDHHLPTLKDSAEASYEAELDRIVEEIASSPYENCLVKGAQLQYAVAEVSPGAGTAQVQKVTQEEVVSDGDGVLAGAQGQLAVSEDLPKESNVAEAARMVVEEKVTESAENSVPVDRDLQPAVSAHEGDTEKEVAPKPALTSGGDEPRRLASDKGESLVKDQPQPQLRQSSESGCPDAGFGSPTNTATMDNGRADRQDEQDSVASPDDASLLLGAPTICCKPSSASVSAEEVSGSLLTQAAESGSRRVRPCGSPGLENRCLSPNKLSPVSGGLKKRVLSPKKGILKRPANGCKGICMCLDCSVFRLRADRAFEFSRKQMEEADDIIGNLLEEVASLRTLAAGKPSGQQELTEEACQRASRVEEVARERQRQMQVELNAHCKIPGPRVKFAQYVDEKMAYSSPGSNNCRRQPPL